MLDRLIDVALQFLDIFRFWCVIDEYERGVVLRFGKYNRTIEPGFHWLWPLAVERVILDNVVTRTTAMAGLDVTTKAGEYLRLDCIVRWRIHDIKKALLEVEGTDDVLKDCTYGIISAAVRDSVWENIIQPEFSQYLTKEARKRAWRYGVEIEEVYLGDLCRPIPVALLQ